MAQYCAQTHKLPNMLCNKSHKNSSEYMSKATSAVLSTSTLAKKFSSMNSNATKAAISASGNIKVPNDYNVLQTATLPKPATVPIISLASSAMLGTGQKNNASRRSSSSSSSSSSLNSFSNKAIPKTSKNKSQSPRKRTTASPRKSSPKSKSSTPGKGNKPSSGAGDIKTSPRKSNSPRKNAISKAPSKSAKAEITRKLKEVVAAVEAAEEAAQQARIQEDAFTREILARAALEAAALARVSLYYGPDTDSRESSPLKQESESSQSSETSQDFSEEIPTELNTPRTDKYNQYEEAAKLVDSCLLEAVEKMEVMQQNSTSAIISKDLVMEEEEEDDDMIKMMTAELEGEYERLGEYFVDDEGEVSEEE